MEKIKIYYDRQKADEFEKSVESVQAEANFLIELYHNFQSLKRITTIQEFESLISDPIKEFDKTIQGMVDLKASGGKQVNPEFLAKMFDIDRENFINIIKGQKITEGCKPCQKSKIIRKGELVLRYAEFEKYQEFLLWEKNHFGINEPAVESHKEVFNKYAETPAQIELYNHFQNFQKVLSEHQKRGYVKDPDQLSKCVGLIYNFQDTNLYLDERTLLNEILKVQ